MPSIGQVVIDDATYERLRGDTNAWRAVMLCKTLLESWRWSPADEPSRLGLEHLDTAGRKAFSLLVAAWVIHRQRSAGIKRIAPDNKAGVVVYHGPDKRGNGLLEITVLNERVYDILRCALRVVGPNAKSRTELHLSYSPPDDSVPRYDS